MPKPYEPWESDPNEYSTDYRNLCGHCRGYLKESDRYCRCCGTKRGEGEFRPYRNIMECIYGPAPVNRTHKCQSCRYSYTVALMIDNEQYCPRCGGETIITNPNPWSPFNSDW